MTILDGIDIELDTEAFDEAMEESRRIMEETDPEE